MSTVDLARLQFASTSIYHFLFVPLTIGLSVLTATLQTAWHRGGRAEYLRLTRFFGTLLVINIAVGVVTGLVQEFQFGMNWSGYSRFVGDVFGAPLAMEGLAAFFLESVFLGLWLFGWNRMSPRLHLAAIWMVAFGGILSAAFIMAANSWMQHPVGYTIDATTGRARLTSIWAVLGNPVFLWGYLHVLLASLVTAAVVMLAVSAWHLRRALVARSPGGTEARGAPDASDAADAADASDASDAAEAPGAPGSEVFSRSAKLAVAVLVPASIAAVLVGSELGVIEGQYQPMKIAAAEAQWSTCQPCSFSLFQIGGGKNDHTPTQIFAVPHLLSLLATNSWNGKVVGLDPLQSQSAQRYGAGNYVPNVFVQYWSMRVMAYIGGAITLLALWGAWLVYRKKLERSRLFLRVATWAAAAPFITNTAGWFLTENGRQPWIVQGLQLTKNAASPSVSATALVISLVVFLGLYAVLAVTDAVLMTHFARKELAAAPDREHGPDRDDTSVLEFSY
jgi:cytochrome d ubiquinol oxidase subunit I